MSRIRRWIGRYVALALIASLSACGAFAPSTPQRPPPAPSLAAPLAPTNHDALGDFLSVVQNPPIHQVSLTNDHKVRLVHALAERFKKPEALIQRVVKAANAAAYKGYPSRNDILAVIAVESGFDPKAVKSGSLGLMQVLSSAHRKALRGINPYNIEHNVSVGASILRDYYESLRHNKRSSILAYNVGIGSFLKKQYKIEYYRKYLRELAFINSIQR